MKKYNLITLTAMLAIALCFTACSKGDIDPKEKIEAELAKMAPKVRQSIEEAKIGIESYFNMKYGQDVTRNGAPVNLLDTTYTFQRVAEAAWNENGNPLPMNQISIQNMYDICGEYQTLVELRLCLSSTI